MSTELIIRHPNVNIDEVQELTQKPEGIKTTPHIGSLNQHDNPHYLALGGVGVNVKSVNTGVLNDRNGRPTIQIVNGSELPLGYQFASNLNLPSDFEVPQPNTARAKKMTLPGVAMVPKENVGTSEVVSLEQFHIDPVRATGITTGTMTEYINDISSGSVRPGEVMALIIKSSGDTPLRLAIGGMIRSQNDRYSGSEVDKYGVYGSGEDPNSGLMVSVQGMMAAEIVEAALNEQDEVHHIGGADMTRYTKEAAVMQKVKSIAQGVLSQLGIKPPKKLVYNVYNKNGGITGLPELSDKIAQKIGIDNFSQHDLPGGFFK